MSDLPHDESCALGSDYVSGGPRDGPIPNDDVVWVIDTRGEISCGGQDIRRLDRPSRRAADRRSSVAHVRD